MKDTIQILMTFDRNCMEPFQTMLYSMVANNLGERFHVWLLHSGLAEDELRFLERYCEGLKVEFSALHIDKTYFEHAPVMKQYPREMYYRLLASEFLPDSVKRVFYLDPDVLIINPVRALWELDLNGMTYAAASHSWGLNLVNGINRIRLDTGQDYFNTGVMLMDLVRARTCVNPDDINDYVKRHAAELVLPDQDIFNALYGNQTRQIDDMVWNYDSRYYSNYKGKSEGLCTMDWMMQNTVVIHFCGRAKPWRKSYSGRFAALYKNYWHKAQRYREGCFFQNVTEEISYI